MIMSLQADRWIYIILSSMLVFTNIFFLDNAVVSNGVVFCFVIVLLLLFCKNKYSEYLRIYLICVATTLEYPYYYSVDEVYGFKGMEIFGISILYYLTAPMFILTCFELLISNKRHKNKLADQFMKMTIVLFIIASMAGIINIVTEDKPIDSMPGIWAAYADEIMMYFLYVFIPLIAFKNHFVEGEEDYEKNYYCIVGILAGLINGEIITLITGHYGEMWGDQIIILSLVQMYVPYLLLLYLNKKDGQWSFFPLVYIAIGSFFSIKYNMSSGGLIIAFAAFPLTILMLVQRKKFKRIAVGMLILICTMPFLLAMLQRVSFSALFTYKFEQALSLIKVLQKGGIQNVPFSARIRLIELGNICREYVIHPWQLLFGKGIVGTVADPTGLMYKGGRAGYTELELQAQNFYSLHETFNILFLTNGLAGIVMYFSIVFMWLKRIGRSPFLAIALLWFVFFYGYSVVLSVFGIACLYMGSFALQKETFQYGTKDRVRDVV